eukprot:6492570-Amphidinium_carterae.4
MQHMKHEVRERQHAYMILRALDHQLSLAGIAGLKTFVCKSASRRLQPGESRVLQSYEGQLPYAVPHGVAKRRSVIVSGGKKRYELEEFSGGVRPLAVVCGDQGGSNLPACLFAMEHMQLRLLYLPDPHHRTWNDWKLSVGDQGLWHVVLESAVANNLPHGPWLSESFHTKLQEAFSDYLETATSQDLKFMEFPLQTNVFFVAWEPR